LHAFSNFDDITLLTVRLTNFSLLFNCEELLEFAYSLFLN